MKHDRDTAALKPRQSLVESIDQLPRLPGVYLFKDDAGEIVYIGKAKFLRDRVMNYLQVYQSNMKAHLILSSASTLEHRVTSSELEALLLEARLIKQYQPRYNVVLKEGQPFLYIVITAGKVPDIKLVRVKHRKGRSFGPFLDRKSARKVFDFLIKTFRLHRCGLSIEQGCLAYHMGICAGSCRSDFSEDDYRRRIELAADLLAKGRRAFLHDLDDQIRAANQALAFERARELVGYRDAFSAVFDTLAIIRSDDPRSRAIDLWISYPDETMLMMFRSVDGVLERKFFTYLDGDEHAEYFKSYYRVHIPPPVIVMCDMIDDDELLGDFFKAWHELDYTPIVKQVAREGADHLVRLAILHGEKEIARREHVPALLKRMFQLSILPRSIDCFDISHKQGRYMVGAAVRFTQGRPDPAKRHLFYVHDVEGIDDYAALREVVTRRYKDADDVPDLIMIDGGKGQLNAVAPLLPGVECVSLAKREEMVFSARCMEGKKLDPHGLVGQTLIALRDYAHATALRFHRMYEQRQLTK